MKFDKPFVLKVLYVFLATLITVGLIRYIASFYGQDNLVNTFVLAILVVHVYEGLIDPRGMRKRRAQVLVMQEDIDKIKSEITFLKYFLYKEIGTPIEELNLRASIWSDLEAEEIKKDGETDTRRD